MHQIFEKKKTGKDQNSVSSTIKYSLFLVSTRNDSISGGSATKMECPEGRAEDHFVSRFWKIQKGGGS